MDTKRIHGCANIKGSTNIKDSTVMMVNVDIKEAAEMICNITKFSDRN
jgi:hypothetical protein